MCYGLIGVFMKRDMDLVREILIKLSESDKELLANAFVNEQHTFNEVAYHFDIMKQANLIEANIIKTGGIRYGRAEAVKLTWDGNEFLANISSNEIWDKVKMKVAQTTGDASIAIFSKLAIDLIKMQFGLT